MIGEQWWQDALVLRIYKRVVLDIDPCWSASVVSRTVSKVFAFGTDFLVLDRTGASLQLVRFVAGWHSEIIWTTALHFPVLPFPAPVYPALEVNDLPWHVVPSCSWRREWPEGIPPCNWQGKFIWSDKSSNYFKATSSFAFQSTFYSAPLIYPLKHALQSENVIIGPCGFCTKNWASFTEKKCIF